MHQNFTARMGNYFPAPDERGSVVFPKGGVRCTDCWEITSSSTVY